MAQHMNVEYIRLYTDGNAALKLESATPAYKKASQTLSGKVKRIKVFVDPVAMLSILVAVCMIAMMCVGFYQLHQTRQQTQMMQSYVERLEAENTKLTNEYKTGYNLDEIRMAALQMQLVPAEQASHVMIHVPAEQEPVQQITLWERIGTFLTGLFA